MRIAERFFIFGIDKAGPPNSELPGDHRDEAARLVGLFEDYKLLLVSPTPAALYAGHHIKSSEGAEDIFISMVVFLFLSLRNTDGAVVKMSNSVRQTLMELFIYTSPQAT